MSVKTQHILISAKSSNFLVCCWVFKILNHHKVTEGKLTWMEQQCWVCLSKYQHDSIHLLCTAWAHFVILCCQLVTVNKSVHLGAVKAHHLKNKLLTKYHKFIFNFMYRWWDCHIFRIKVNWPQPFLKVSVFGVINVPESTTTSNTSKNQC